ncbi:hypothetical protein PSCICL_45550 [Pseudomonas cichorii]|nr:hypothetical protein PSCICL_45550 [Pseudomonas cichorii]
MPAIRSRRPLRIVSCRTTYSCSPSDIGSDHIDSTVAQFIADLPPGVTIEVSIYLATLAAVDRGEVLGYLLIALTCVRRS